MNKEASNFERVLLPSEFTVCGKYITDEVTHQTFFEDKKDHLILLPSALGTEEYTNVSLEETRSILGIRDKKLLDKNLQKQ